MPFFNIINDAFSKIYSINHRISITHTKLNLKYYSYEFEKARIRGESDDNILKSVQEVSGDPIPSNLDYLDDFYDESTGTSGTAFKDKTTGEVIVAYTGTNIDSDGFNDVVKSDIGGIALGVGTHYQPAYDFYDEIASKYGAENIVLTGHSLGGNVAQRVALEKNAQHTVVYNAAPLLIPSLSQNPAGIINGVGIGLDFFNFTGQITRITTEKDPLNIISDMASGVYIGDEYILKNSGGHSISDIRDSREQVAQVNTILASVGSAQLDQVEKRLTDSLKGAPSSVSDAMSEVRTKLESFKTNDNHGQATDASGLTGAEKIYIDYAQATTIAGGLTAAASAAVSLVASKETIAVAKAEEIMSHLDAPFGTSLSADEIKAAYQEGGVDETTIVQDVADHCSKKKDEFSSLAQSFTDVQTRIQEGLSELVQTDADLAGLYNG